jgi:WD40 repeat protein
VQIWDIPHQRLLAELPDTAGEGSYLVYSRDGRLLATAEKEVCLWDLTAQPPRQTFRASLPGSAECIAVSREGTTLAVAVADETWVWDVENRVLRHKLPQPATCLALSPDARTLAATTLEATKHGQGPVWLWDLDTGNRTRSLVTSGRGGVASLAFSPDGKTLAGALDSRICLWHVGTGQELYALTYHGAWMIHVEFSADGESLTAWMRGAAGVWLGYQLAVCSWPALHDASAVR